MFPQFPGLEEWQPTTTMVLNNGRLLVGRTDIEFLLVDLAEKCQQVNDLRYKHIYEFCFYKQT